MLGDEAASTRGTIGLAHVSPFSIGALHIQPSTRQICRGQRQETLEPRVMQVLVALWEAGGAVVSRDDLIARCWAGRVVGDNAIQRTISRLRDIAGSIGDGCFRLETVNKVGYRLIAAEPAAAGFSPDIQSRLVGRSRTNDRRRGIITAAVGIATLAIVVALTVWGRLPMAGPTTVAVVGGSSDSFEMARNLAADLARLSNVRGAMAFSEASGTPRANYRLSIAKRGAGNQARTDLALLRNGSSDVLWSASIVGGANLRERAVAAVYGVSECALDANSDPVPLDADELRLIFSGCERLDHESDDIAVSSWRRIVARNPLNARAMATLAYLEAVRSTDDVSSSAAAALRAAAQRHLEKGRDLNPHLGLTYAAEAVLVPNSRYQTKLAVLDRGIERDPDCAVLLAEQSVAFQRVGFTNSAVASARKAAELDPGHASRRTWLALALAYNGLTDEARNELAAVEAIWPDSPVLKDAKDRFDYRYGNAAELIQKIDRGIDVPYSDPTFAQGIEHTFLMARLHPTPANIDNAANVALKNNGSPGVVQNLVALGRVDRAYELLDDPGALALLRENTDVLFRSFMRPFWFDRRFMILAARLGLVQYWLSTNTRPSFCYDKDVPYDCKAEAKKAHFAKAA